MSRKTRILLADDHAVVRQGFKLIINQEPDMEVVGEASDGADAVRLTQTLKPDVVIMDIAMPKVNGWTLAKEVRRRMGSRPLLIAITGHYTKSADKALSHVSGFDHYLTKPADPDVLLSLVAGAKPGE